MLLNSRLEDYHVDRRKILHGNILLNTENNAVEKVHGRDI
jgi:hypothetical protein